MLRKSEFVANEYDPAVHSISRCGCRASLARARFCPTACMLSAAADMPHGAPVTENVPQNACKRLHSPFNVLASGGCVFVP